GSTPLSSGTGFIRRRFSAYASTLRTICSVVWSTSCMAEVLHRRRFGSGSRSLLLHKLVGLRAGGVSGRHPFDNRHQPLRITQAQHKDSLVVGGLVPPHGAVAVRELNHHEVSAP